LALLLRVLWRRVAPAYELRAKKSAAADSAQPEIADRQPPDLKFASMTAAKAKTADDEAANCESGEGYETESERPRSDGPESERAPAAARPFRRSPNRAFLRVFVHYVVHVGESPQRKRELTLPRRGPKDQGSERSARTVATSTAYNAEVMARIAPTKNVENTSPSRPESPANMLRLVRIAPFPQKTEQAHARTARLRFCYFSQRSFITSETHISSSGGSGTSESRWEATNGMVAR
jgi:hypothetical protein